MINDRRPRTMPVEPAKADEIRASLGLLSDQPFLWNIAAASPFLRRLISRHTEDVAAMLEGHGESLVQKLLDTLLTPRPEGEKTKTLMRVLRDLKGRIALITALLDLAGTWDVMQVTHALSVFADRATAIALGHALHSRMVRGKLAWPNGTPEPVSPTLARNSGYFLLGMGKWGGFELNYSSDIDLIALYEPDRASVLDDRGAQELFIRVTREVVDLLDQRTEDGYVFRTDLRLRPDPGATPVVISTYAAESYYQSAALNWERAAMIKARPVAGDMESANTYLARMSGWIWRKSIDYTALADIAAIKDQVVRHYEQGDVNYEGYDVKLGPGGIREIEFYAQINQLLYGGRRPELRTRATIEALDRLVSTTLVEPATRDTLTVAYKNWRTLEHRIQMLADAQTHSIPTHPEERAALLALSGFDTDEELKAVIDEIRHTVSTLYDTLLPDAHAGEAAYAADQLAATLEGMGFAPSGAGLIEGWRRGRWRALKSERSRRLLEDCLPDLLKAFAEAADPDAALSRFDGFVRELPAGVQLFSMLQANPLLFRLLGHIMSLAPALAETLAKRPALWDAVLDPGFFAPIENASALGQELEAWLATARDYQDTLDICRRFLAEQRFRIGVQTLENIHDPEIGTRALSAVADAVLTSLLPRVEADFAERHGRIEGAGLAVIALGQYGSGNLTATSDLDLILAYYTDGNTAGSDGKRPLAPSAYFSRLAQAFITAVTAMTADGRLFEIDTRLRPMGSQGPLAVAFQTLEDYYANDAWTWEYMALTRARIVVAPKEAWAVLDKLLKAPLRIKRAPHKLAADAASMREKLFEASALGGAFDLKHGRGGLVDIEFITQMLLLRHAPQTPSLLHADVPKALEALATAGHLSQADAGTLIPAYRELQALQAGLRLCLGERLPAVDGLPAGLKAFMLGLSNQPSVTALTDHLAELRAHVTNCFERLVDKAARAGPQQAP